MRKKKKAHTHPVYALVSELQRIRPAELLLAGPTMGTRYTIKVVADEQVSAERRAALEAGIDRALNAVDSSMSTWREDSELVRFNRHGTESFKASPAFLEVLAYLFDHVCTKGSFKT